MNKPTTLFWVIAILALLWNLMGITAFLMDTFAQEMMLEGYTQAQIDVAMAAPFWTKIAYGVATITGLLGAFMLLARKAWAVPLFLISLIASVFHSGYIIFGMDGMDTFGAFEGLILPLIIIVLDVFFWQYAKRSRAKNWIH